MNRVRGASAFALLDDADRAAVLAHVQRCFPELLGTDPSARTLEDLPVLDREQARPWYGRAVPGARTFHSTGTSGYPKPIAWTAAEDAWYVGEKRELFGDWLAGVGRGFISLAVGHNADSARQVFQDLGIRTHDAGLAPLDLQCADVARFDPEVLYCSPAILARLVTELDDRDLALPSVRRVITNGEVLFPATRAALRDRFGLRDDEVIDTYGSTEVGTIAATCPTCGAYHFVDGVLPEAVDPGLVGEADLLAAPGADLLALTSVKRTSFPVVRLLTYDVVQGLRRSRCTGRDRYSFDRVLGRCDDVLNYGELFPAHDLGALVAEHRPHARWFVFNGANDLTLVVEGEQPDGFAEAFAARFPLHAEMARLGLIDPPRWTFLTDFDGFVARSGLPDGRGKAGRRVHHRFDPAWLDG